MTRTLGVSLSLLGTPQPPDPRCIAEFTSVYR
jgi:hypothetical protein